MQIQPGAAIPLTTLIQGDVRTTQPETRAETAVDEVVQGGQPTMAVASEPNEAEKLPGVLRLLQAGHFKGVADVRLRIVHADRIAALESEQARAGVTESSGSLTSSVASTVAELADASDSVSAEQADAAVASFDEQVNAAIDTSFASGGFDVDTIESSLRTAFQTLVDQLELGSTVHAEVTEDVDVLVASDTIDNAPGEGSRDFLAELNEIFSAELARILASADGESMLPPISEPSGNGRAFEKFLAMYNEILSGETVVDEPSTIEIVA